jgi:hypothetical protein
MLLLNTAFSQIPQLMTAPADLHITFSSMFPAMCDTIPMITEINKLSLPSILALKLKKK